MNILEAKNEIKKTVTIYLDKDEDGRYVVPLERQRPVLLIGAPGIGKTAIMSRIGEELGIGFLSYTMTHHTRQSALGLPFIAEKTFGGKKYSVTEYTMSEIVKDVYDAIERQGKKEGILFLDEINCVSETLAPAMLELLQHKKFGSHEIPRGWVLVAAGNPEEYNKSATELDMVTLDRVKKMEVSPDYDAFALYAVNNGVHESVTFFLSENRDKLFYAERGQTEYEFVTPRGWEDLSYALRAYEKFGYEVTLSLVTEYVRSAEIASSFFRFYNLFGRYRELLSSDDAENGRTESVSLEGKPFDERFAVAEILRGKICRIASAAVGSYGNYRAAKEEIDRIRTEEDGKKTADLYRIKAEDPSVDSVKRKTYKTIVELLCRPSPTEALSEEYENVLAEGKSAEEKIDRLLAFAEKSLGKRQELTAMLTTLVANEDFVSFLTLFGSDGFYRLNDELLIGPDDSALRKRAADLLSERKEIKAKR